MSLRRRELLAAGVAGVTAAVGGCAGCAPAPTASLSLERASDADLAAELIGWVPATPVTEEGELSKGDRLVRTAIEEGEATVETAGDPPVPDRTVYRDTIYRLTAESVASRTVLAFRIHFEPFRGSESTPGPSQRVAVGELPAVDRRILRERGFLSERPPGVGTTFSYRPEQTDASALVPEPDRPVVVWPDGAARFVVDDRDEVTVRTYRITSEAVGDAATRGRELREAVGFRVAGVSSEVGEILRQAAGDGYRIDADRTPTEAFRTLVDRFRSETRARPDRRGESGVSGAYVVRWDGDWWWAELFVNDESFTVTE